LPAAFCSAFSSSARVVRERQRSSAASTSSTVVSHAFAAARERCLDGLRIAADELEV